MMKVKMSWGKYNTKILKINRIVMEYADKGDLYQKICEFKKASVAFEESDIWRIFIQIAGGLKTLHDMKILHRDLKSANVFLHKDGSAKLGDLNVSKVARRGLGYTQTGTPYYARYKLFFSFLNLSFFPLVPKFGKINLTTLNQTSGP